jgi:hypothetical protein
MPLLIVIAIAVFFAFKLGLFNEIDYATTPYDRMTCEDVADAVLGSGIENGLGTKYVIKGVSNIERVSKDAEEIICRATVRTDANTDLNLLLTGRSDSSSIKIRHAPD